jgi:hypothetical protein
LLLSACVAWGGSDPAGPPVRQSGSKAGRARHKRGNRYIGAVTARQVSHHVGKIGALGHEVALTRRPDPDPGDDTRAA